MPLTDDEKKAYVDSGGSRCPYCFSQDVTAGRHDADNDYVAFEITCETCGRIWSDIHKLADIVESEDDVTMIHARAYLDNQTIEVEFDAAPWFRQAPDADIKALVKCGFGGDVPADSVALFMSDHCPRLRQLFEFIELNNLNRDTREHLGFECHVDQADARAWIAGNRPGINKIGRAHV